MKDLISGLIALGLGIGLHALEYDITVTEQGMKYSTSEATYLWPRTLVEERSTKEEAQ